MADLARFCVERFRDGVTTADASTADVAHAAGFGSQSSFYDHLTRQTGTTPAAYRRGRQQ